MYNNSALNGVVHNIDKDISDVLTVDQDLLYKWNNLTPLARNEWICWIISCAKSQTRANHINRMTAELKSGKRRPCCWAGCPHRPDRVVKQYTKGHKPSI